VPRGWCYTLKSKLLYFYLTETIASQENGKTMSEDTTCVVIWIHGDTTDLAIVSGPALCHPCRRLSWRICHSRQRVYVLFAIRRYHWFSGRRGTPRAHRPWAVIISYYTSCTVEDLLFSTQLLRAGDPETSPTVRCGA
jgi:hypothetical protein